MTPEDLAALLDEVDRLRAAVQRVEAERDQWQAAVESQDAALTLQINEAVRWGREREAERDRLRAAVQQAREVIDDITITDPGLVVVRVGKILDTLAGDDDG